MREKLWREENEEWGKKKIPFFVLSSDGKKAKKEKLSREKKYFSLGENCVWGKFSLAHFYAGLKEMSMLSPPSLIRDEESHLTTSCIFVELVLIS